MKAIVDQDVCIGCGMCASMCDAVFTMNDNGLSEAVSDSIADEFLNDAEEAKDCCPVDAISIEE